MSRLRGFAIAALLCSSAAHALVPPDRGFGPSAAAEHVARQAFFKPDLYISTGNASLGDHMGFLGNAAEWEHFFARHGSDFHVYLDPRSGVPSGIMGPIPFIPGTGYRNNVTLRDLEAALGRPVAEVTPKVVGDLFLRWVHENRGALALEPAQLGEPRVTQVADYLWQIHIPQRVGDIPVRHGRLAATVNHGNLVLVGTESWENVTLGTRPTIDGNDALNLGFARLGGWYRQDVILKVPTLEIIPYAAVETYPPGSIGGGYGHRLAWVFEFERLPDNPRWEVVVDAHTGEVLSIQDTNHYATERIMGSVYPLTNTGICPTPETCGTAQPNYPMPFANTGLAAPNNFTSTSGTFDYTSGTVTTTLNGRYVRMSDSCGPISMSGSGTLQMGGTNNQHDCTTPGFGGAGNTFASRSGFYELNKLIEMARGWLPANTWLNGQLTSNMNLNSTCNAFWNGTTINFYRSGGGCRNTGEIAAVFDHEWGHGMDDNDANGSLSNSSEGYADIAGILRLEASCVGHGFFQTVNFNCGMTVDGTGFNYDEDQTGGLHCMTDCSGVRDSDWAKHSDNTPDTPQNFVCGKCSSSGGPCGRQVHCAAAVQRQAGWDLAARDLQAAPFSYPRNFAFIIANKTFYLGSGNIGTWYACNCTAGTSDGCASTSGYRQWLAADDDNGNINDGTPHMSALFAAFNRHNIACATPTVQNSGCAGAPTTAPTLSVSGSNNQANLTWNAVAGATRYWVMRGEGFGACNFGKARIATVTGTSYTDATIANGNQYCYSVVPAAATDACFGPASNCACVTPSTCPAITLSPGTLPNGTVGVAYSQGVTASGGTAPYTYAVTAGALPTGLSLNGSSGAITGTPSAAGTFNFTITATDSGGCAGSQAYAVTIACPAITVSPGTLPNGTVGTAYSQTVSGSGGTAPYTFAVTAGSLPAGLSLNGTSGLVSGTPTTSGSSSFTITATDAAGCAGSQGYTVNVTCPTITLSPSSLPNGTTGVPYSQSVTASGGNAPYTYAVIAGALPAGLSLDGNTGAITGTPTTPGTSSFTLNATDAFGCTMSGPYTITIDCAAITLSPATLPAGTRNVPYSQAVTASGGTAPYTYAVTAGSLPAGLSLDGNTGIISGTPTAVGSSSFTITATDAVGCTGSQAYTLDINCASITITPATLTDGTEGIPYSVTFAASGGTAPYTWSVGGSLPPGLSLNGTSGTMSGTPSAAGSYAFDIVVTDATGCTAFTGDGKVARRWSSRASYTMDVNAAVDYVVGEGLGQTNGNVVKAYRRNGTASAVSFAAYGSGQFGTNVSAGDINGAIYGEILTGPGPGAVYGPHVRGWDRNGTPLAKVSFFAYSTLKFGANVGAGEVEGDAFHEMITGPGPGAVFGPHVRGWNYDNVALATIAKINFFAYSTLKYGVQVGAGSVDADATAELLTGPGSGQVFGPQVKGWNYDGTTVTAMAKINFFAFTTPQFGCRVAAGDADADGFAEIAAAPGAGPTLPAQVKGFDYDGVAVAAAPGFDVTNPGLYGASVALGDLAADGGWDVAAGGGPDPAVTSITRGYTYSGSALVPLTGSGFTPFPGDLYGVNVGAGSLGHF